MTYLHYIPAALQELLQCGIYVRQASINVKYRIVIGLVLAVTLLAETVQSVAEYQELDIKNVHIIATTLFKERILMRFTS